MGLIFKNDIFVNKGGGVWGNFVVLDVNGCLFLQFEMIYFAFITIFIMEYSF